jgi:toxin ParE1/3/4
VKVRLTPSARVQFLSAVSYIRNHDPLAARKFRRRVEQALRRLGRFPRSGRSLPEFPDLPFREVIVAPYRFCYRVTGRTLWVVAVKHGAQLQDEPPDV